MLSYLLRRKGAFRLIPTAQLVAIIRLARIGPANTNVMQCNTCHDDVTEVGKSTLFFLYRKCHLPFNIPYPFSVTNLAPHSLLLKYFCCSSRVFSLYVLSSHSYWGRALSPMVTSWIFPKSPNRITGLISPCKIAVYIQLF